MSNDRKQPTTISLVPSTVAFTVLTVVTVVVAIGSMFFNANGNTF